MNRRSGEPDFGATGQFELTGVYFVDKKVDAAFATTLGMDRIKTLLLLGVGPAQLQVLDHLARHRRSDLDVTLVHPWSYWTHSGMVPGYVAGHYPLPDCQIDLQPLMREAGARWVAARCAGLDAHTRTLMLDYGDAGPGSSTDAAGQVVQRPTMLSYDLLSVDGPAPATPRTLNRLIPGASDHAWPTQPSEPFVNRWTQVLNRCKAQPGRTWSFSVLGHEAAAIELAFAMQQGLLTAGFAATVKLLTLGQPLAPDLPSGLLKRVRGQLQSQGIEVVTAPVRRIQAQQIDLADDRVLPSDANWLAIGQSPPDWLAHSGLTQAPTGLIQVNAHLQSPSHPQVFAAGELAARGVRPEDQGATADNAGSDLALNLLASLSEQPLSVHRPAERSIQVLVCGAGQGVAQWGFIAGEGRWAWSLRDKHDRAWVTRFRR